MKNIKVDFKKSMEINNLTAGILSFLAIVGIVAFWQQIVMFIAACIVITVILMLSGLAGSAVRGILFDDKKEDPEEPVQPGQSPKFHFEDVDEGDENAGS